MTLYILLAASPLLLTPIINSYYKSSVATNRRARKALLVWFGLLLFVMIALRSRYLGTKDSSIYYDRWGMLGSLDFVGFKNYVAESRTEIGFLYVVWLLSHIFPPGQFIFITSGLLFTVAVCRYVYKYSPNPTLSLVMFVALGEYGFMVQALRQAVAMSICLMSLEFCRQRKLLKFLLVIFIATLFHQTAIVFIIVYFLYGFTMNIKMYAALSATGVLLIVFSNQVVRLGNDFFDRNFENAVDSGGFVAVAVYVIILVTAVIFAGYQKNSKNYTFFFLITAIGFIFYIMRYTGALVTERISFYFMFGQMICLPMVLERFDKRANDILNVVISALSIALFIYRLSGSSFVQYHFFWWQ